MCQIWVIHDDAPTPSGLFDPEANMTAAAVTTSIEKATLQRRRRTRRRLGEADR
jgi:hypothetical protein